MLSILTDLIGRRSCDHLWTHKQCCCKPFNWTNTIWVVTGVDPCMCFGIRWMLKMAMAIVMTPVLFYVYGFQLLVHLQFIHTSSHIGCIAHAVYAWNMEGWFGVVYCSWHNTVTGGHDKHAGSSTNVYNICQCTWAYVYQYVQSLEYILCVCGCGCLGVCVHGSVCLASVDLLRQSIVGMWSTKLRSL